MAIGNDNDVWGTASLARGRGRALEPMINPTWPAGIGISDEPVRRVHTRSRHRNTSWVYSTLPLGMRVSESQSETRFFQVAQLEPRVTAVRAQPVGLKFCRMGGSVDALQTRPS